MKLPFSRQAAEHAKDIAKKYSCIRATALLSCNVRLPSSRYLSNWRKYTEEVILHPPVSLHAAPRRDIEKAIRDCCAKRGWTILAINVRTNHVQVVVAMGAKTPKNVLIALKANSTRQMRDDGLWLDEHSP